MKSVLGLGLEHAQELLREQGYGTVAVSTSSRKGVPGDCRRVVRQRLLPDGRVELVYSVFHLNSGIQ